MLWADPRRWYRVRPAPLPLSPFGYRQQSGRGWQPFYAPSSTLVEWLERNQKFQCDSA
jgi:hypothetical protein